MTDIRPGKLNSSLLHDQHRRDRNAFVQPISPSLARDNLAYTKIENYNMHEDSKVNIDASEHISNRLHRTAQLMRKSRYSRNNSQSNLSDYASPTSSSVRVPDQIANPSHK